jgi:hypothetical protein
MFRTGVDPMIESRGRLSCPLCGFKMDTYVDIYVRIAVRGSDPAGSRDVRGDAVACIDCTPLAFAKLVASLPRELACDPKDKVGA